MIAPQFASSPRAKTHPKISVAGMNKKSGALGESIEGGHSFRRHGGDSFVEILVMKFTANDVRLLGQLLANNLVLLPMGYLTGLTTIPDSFAAHTTHQGYVAVTRLVAGVARHHLFVGTATGTLIAGIHGVDHVENVLISLHGVADVILIGCVLLGFEYSENKDQRQVARRDDKEIFRPVWHKVNNEGTTPVLLLIIVGETIAE